MRILHWTTRLPSTTVSKIFQNALFHMQLALYTLIWKPHCHDTIRWEKLHNIDPKTKHTYDSELRKQRASITTTTHTTTHSHSSTTNENQLWDLSLRAWLSTHLGSWSLSPLPPGSLLATAPGGTP